MTKNQGFTISELDSQNNICDDDKSGVKFDHLLTRVNKYEITGDKLFLNRNDTLLAKFKAAYMLQYLSHYNQNFEIEYLL